MDKRLETLLTEYESITGRSKDWRQDLSVEDFLRFKSYSKTMAINTGEVEISTQIQGNSTVVEDRPVAKSNIIKANELEEKREVKKFTTSKSTSPPSKKDNDNNEDPVTILKSIID